jgi:hypothetical protein
MIRSGLKNYLNSQYPYVLKLNNNQEMDKFVLASKILLNDLQAIPVSSCPGREECSNCMLNNCDSKILYKTPVYEKALIDPYNVVNSNVTKYIDGYNPNTFNPQISRMSQPLDTIGLYQDNTHKSMMNYNKSTGYGPETKVRLEEHFDNPTTHPIPDAKNTLYSQYSSIFLNNNGEGYYQNELVNQINNEKPTIRNTFRKIHNNKIL